MFLLATAFLLQQAATKPSIFEFIDPHRDVVASAKGAFALMPPELVDSEDVSQSSWSTDGSFLMYEKDVYRPSINDSLELTNTPDDVEQYIYFWDSRTHKKSLALSLGPHQGKFDQAIWLTGANIALVVMRQSFPSSPDRKLPVDHYSVLRVVPGSNQPQVLLEDEVKPNDPGVAIQPSPTTALALVYKIAFNPEEATSRARQISSLVVDNGSRLLNVKGTDPASIITFGPTGKPIYLSPEPNAPKGRRKLLAFPIDEKTGDIGPEDIKGYRPAGEEARPAAIAIETTKLAATNQKVSKDLKMVWLSSTTPSDQPRAFVAGEADQSCLSPALNAVSFRSQGSLFVRELVSFSLDKYLVVRNEVAKRDAMNHAKSVGTGILMYAADMDDKAPTSKEFATAIQPYLRNSDVLNGFSYTYTGGPLDKLPDASKTALGYTEGPGGRAMVYADGHVRWIPNG